MEIISGFEGKDIEKIIATIKEVWEKQGIKSKGGQARYQLIIGTLNRRALFTPTVSTRAGTETIIIWNLSYETIKELTNLARKLEIPLGYRSYIWFGEPPNILPYEKEEQKEYLKNEEEKQ